ncbi:MAG: ThuA domain-containing protein [Bacteroidota bacterium]
MRLSAYLLLLFISGLLFSCNNSKKDINILVFSKTEGFRHASIGAGKKALLDMGEKYGFKVDTTEDANYFQEKNLKKYNAVVFLNTTGDIFNPAQQLEFQRFIQAGGGFLGIHAAADTEYDWPWYGKLVGGYFNGHPNNPNVRAADIQRIDKEHISTKHLPDTWHRSDEWYNYKQLNPDATVLLNLDETTYEGGTNGENHPIAWYHEYDGGRAFYTGSGHTNESFEEEALLKHLWGGIQYVVGDGEPVNYKLESVAPQENRFVKHTLDQNLSEPMELEMLPDGKIIFVERKGAIKVYDPAKRRTTTIHEMEVWTKFEDGLLGVTLDPNFEENRWVYLFYSDPNEIDQNISRFVMGEDYLSIDMDSEKVVIEIPKQRDECCHSGGSLEFDAKGNLFISVGDDTNPFQSNGYSPSDGRPGRKPFDARRSSANTMDLRGKILRIKPEADGSYSIPEGNLFTDPADGRPEIYVMGCRNPFRIAIDDRTGFLYWGDVGPDARKDSIGLGPKGHDEVNQARQAGFFGWPLFVGNNKAYHKRDFAKQVAYEAFDPQHPINESPNNTGIKNLPPAQPAFIWYPYGESEEFPLVGNGGRNAMAGPVFYTDDYEANEGRFPAYFHGKLMAYDWMRGYIMAVTMNEAGDFKSMERIMPSHKFSNPTDIIFSPQGDMYLLEYGTKWFSQNMDARLVHIEYISGNRKPIADFEADKTVGAAPLTVNFSGDKAEDFDDEPLTYEWYFTGFEAVQSNEKSPTFTFEEAGEYDVYLMVTDSSGESSEKSMKIYVGNDMPQLAWKIEGNQTFYWNDQDLVYTVNVSDKEDGTLGSGIEADQVAVTIDYLERGFDANEIAMGHQTISAFAAGKALMAKSDCSTCHQKNEKSIGPTYLQIAAKYKADDTATKYLAGKIIRGGGGVWGERAMAAHPKISEEDATKMAEYILSLGDEKEKERLPAIGTYAFDQHEPTNTDGTYILTASYTDRGGEAVGALTAQKIAVLRHPNIRVSQFDAMYKASKSTLDKETSQGLVKDELEVVVGAADAYVMCKNIDLTDVASINLTTFYNPQSFGGGTIRIRKGSKDGDIIGEVEVDQTPGLVQMPSNIIASEGKHDLYLTFEDAVDGKPVVALVNLVFSNKAIAM